MPRHKKHWLGASLRTTKGSFCVRRLGGCYGHPKKVASPYRSMCWRIEAAVLAGYWSDVLHRHLECTQRTTSPATLLQVHQGNVQLLVVFLFILFSLEGALRTTRLIGGHRHRVTKIGKPVWEGSPTPFYRFKPLNIWKGSQDLSMLLGVWTQHLWIRSDGFTTELLAPCQNAGLGRNEAGWGPRCGLPRVAVSAA